jgi:hypothetical protein
MTSKIKYLKIVLSIALAVIPIIITTLGDKDK